MTNGRKKFEQVAARIETMIAAGVLHSGDRIASVRAMAAESGFSVMTVTEGYRLLEERGVIESVPQSGYFVRPEELRRPGAAGRPPEARQEAIRLQTEFVKISPLVEKVLAEAGRENILPLGAGLPEARFLASEELSLRLARVCRADPEAVNRYCIGPGVAALRQELARRMIDSGCATGPDEIVVTGGATQALLISLRAVTQAGDTVAIESPGFHGFYSMLQFLQLKAMEIPCDPQLGFSVSTLEKIIRGGEKISCVLMSSTYSNPTGSNMPDWKKEKLTRLCAAHEIPIIDDDIYGDLAFAPPRPRSLKSFDADNVIHIGSLSKVLAPGYRIGWTAGGRHCADIRRCHAVAVLSVPLPNQLAVAAFLQDGAMKRHLRKLCRVYAENMRLFQAAVAESFPWGTCTSNPEGGHFLWVRLPEGCDAVKLAEESIRRGISIAPGNIFSSREHYRNFIRLNTAVAWSRETAEALRLLGKLAGAQTRAS